MPLAGDPTREEMVVDTFSWEHLTTRPASTESLDALTVGSLIVFAILFLILAALALWPRRWGLQRRLGRIRYGRWLSVGAWIAAFGLMGLIVRLMQIDPFTLGRPIWQLIAMLVMFVWVLALVWMIRGEPARVKTVNVPTRRPRKGGSYR